MSTTTTTFVATDPSAYEQFMGRWSQRLAPSFVDRTPRKLTVKGGRIPWEP